jgi:hypothetical protein
MMLSRIAVSNSSSGQPKDPPFGHALDRTRQEIIPARPFLSQSSSKTSFSSNRSSESGNSLQTDMTSPLQSSHASKASLADMKNTDHSNWLTQPLSEIERKEQDDAIAYKNNIADMEEYLTHNDEYTLFDIYPAGKTLSDDVNSKIEELDARTSELSQTLLLPSKGSYKTWDKVIFDNILQPYAGTLPGEIGLTSREAYTSRVQKYIFDNAGSFEQDGSEKLFHRLALSEIKEYLSMFD